MAVLKFIFIFNSYLRGIIDFIVNGVVLRVPTVGMSSVVEVAMTILGLCVFIFLYVVVIVVFVD
jgi:hypothetical protein